MKKYRYIFKKKMPQIEQYIKIKIEYGREAKITRGEALQV